MKQQQTRLQIILIGETCWDNYRCGTVNRISPEAPVPVLDWDGTETKHKGMAANVCANFENLGAKIELHTRFVSSLTRYFSGQHQLLRVDTPLGGWSPFDPEEIEDWKADAIVISDYNKGFVSYETIRYIRAKYHGPMFIDTKKPDLSQFEGIITKINNDEWHRRISEHPNSDQLIVTGGSGKIRSGEEEWSPKAIKMVDACGAGDTFFAAYVVGYLTTNNKSAAIEFAMKAAGITVQHLGVYAPTLEEIK